MSDEMRRVTVNLSARDYAFLLARAQSRGTTLSDEIRTLIHLGCWLDDLVGRDAANPGTLIVERDGKQREIAIFS